MVHDLCKGRMAFLAHSGRGFCQTLCAGQLIVLINKGVHTCARKTCHDARMGEVCDPSTSQSAGEEPRRFGACQTAG